MAVRRSMDRPDLSRIEASEIPRHFSGLDLEGMDQLLRNPNLGSRHVVSLLRNLSLPESVVQRICEEEDLLADYRVKAALTLHPHTPRSTALEMLHHLLWRDLLHVMDNLRVHPVVRRTAENLLGERLEGMTLGERVTLARVAGRGALRMLRTIQDQPVVKALLGNSRLTEEDVLFMAARGESRPEVLRVIGRTPRWANRYSVRLVLARNPSTPPAVTLGFLTSLRDQDLMALIHTSHVPVAVRKTAARIIEQGRPGE